MRKCLKVISALLIAVLALSLSACGSEADRFVGTWNAVPGTDQSAMGIKSQYISITFNSDGTYRKSEYVSFMSLGSEEVEIGKFVVDKDKGTVTFKPDKDPDDYLAPDYEFQYYYQITDTYITLENTNGRFEKMYLQKQT